MEKIIIGSRTKAGYPALWESGGFGIEGRSATIIANSRGERPRAVFMNNDWRKKNGEHALVVIKEGFFIIKAYDDGDENLCLDVYEVKSYKVLDSKSEILVELKNRCLGGKWERILWKKLIDPIKAAKEKANCEDCTVAFYVVSVLGVDPEPRCYNR